VPSYRYTAYNIHGQLIKNSITATSKSRAILELQDADLMVESVTPLLSASFGKSGIKLVDFYRVISQLISLLHAGISLTESISIVVSRGSNSSKNYFSAILESLKKGLSLSESCAEYPEVFDNVFLSLVKTGERSGDLVGSLRQYQKYVGMRLELAGVIRQALVYPVFLLIVITIVIAILLVYVVPNFLGLFESLDAQLPLPTRVVVSLADYAPLGIVVIFLVVPIVAGIKRMYQLPNAWKIKLDRFSRSLPFYGNLRSDNQTAKFVRMLSSILASGSPLVVTLKNVGESFTDTYLGIEIKNLISRLESGDSLAKSIDELSILPDHAKQMISVGERSGSLTEMLNDVALFCEERFSEKLKYATTLIEPVLMLTLGILVGGIIISMYLPIFHMADVIQ